MSETEKKQLHDLFHPLWKACWGINDTFRKNLPLPGRNIGYLDFTGEHYEAMHTLCLPILDQPKVFIFGEYHQAMEIFRQPDEEELYLKGACILGQPGIGKSTFIAYAVVERLREKRPVAVQITIGHRDDGYVIFSQKGVSAHHRTDTSPLTKCEEVVWAFSDSNMKVELPTIAFLFSTNVRLFQTTSLDARRWRNWVKERNFNKFIMDLPSEPEIEDLARVLGHDVKRAKDVAAKWGRVPRLINTFYKGPDSERETTRESEAATAARHAVRLSAAHLRDIITPDGQFFPALLIIFFHVPKKTPRGILRTCSTIFIPTSHLSLCLAEALADLAVETQTEFYTTLWSRLLTTRRSAGWIYKNLIHCFFVRGGTKEHKAVDITWYRPQPHTPSSLKLSAVNNVSSMMEVLRSEPPFYWYSPGTNISGIDSVYVTDKYCILLQMTLSDEHDGPAVDVKTIWDKVDAEMHKLQWGVLFVGPEKYRIKSASTRYSDGVTVEATQNKGKGRKKAKNEVTVPVGYAVISPGKFKFEAVVDISGKYAYEGDSMDTSS